MYTLPYEVPPVPERKLRRFVLVKKDGLSFFMDVKNLEETECDAYAEVFRSTFNRVWDQIPLTDRGCLLQYWRSESVAWFPDPPFKPLIQLLEIGPWSPSHIAIGVLGFEMTFPTALVAYHKECLPRVVTSTLVHAFRYANGDFWRLHHELIDARFASWDRKRERTEKARDKKYAALGKRYLLHHEAQVAAVLRTWGFEKGC
jgi:hypothetical protein